MIWFLDKIRSAGFIAIASAVLSFYLASLFYGVKIGKLELEMSQNSNTAIAKVVEAEKKAAKAAQQVQGLIAEKRIEAEKRYNEIQRDIKENRKNLSLGKDVDVDEWVRYHDKSVPMSGPTHPSAGVNSGPSGVQDNKTELETVIENYKSCQIAVDRLKGWKDWYERLQNGK